MQQQVARTAFTPLQLGVSFNLKVDNKTEEARAYLARVRDRMKLANSSEYYNICGDSPLFPREDREHNIAEFAHGIRFEVQIFRRPVERLQHPWFEAGNRSLVPDLAFDVRTPPQRCIHVSKGFDAILVRDGVDIARSEMATGGRVFTAVDLIGAQVFVKPPVLHCALECAGDRRGVFSFEFVHPRFDILFLHVASLGTLHVPLREFPAEDGGYIYTYTFPARLEDF